MDDARDVSGRPFLGTGWSFPPAFARRLRAGPLGAQPRHGVGAELVSAERDIEQSLRILLSTTPGERLMQPSYGCGIKKLVFERLSESLLTEIRQRIAEAILFFEPRIAVDEIAMDVDDWAEGLLRIRVDYTVRSTNSRANMVYPLYFREGTGLPVAGHG